MGDELVVVVACDNTVRKRKHEPITPEMMRLRIISSLKPVDKAVLGKDGNMYDIIETVRPDMIVLGFDQAFDDGELEKELKKRKINAEIRRASECGDDLTGTRRIIEKIIRERGEEK